MTDDVNIYNKKHNENKLAIKIIDTPGIRDQRGIVQDSIIIREKITDKFKNRFNTINAFLFIVQFSNERLT